MKRLLSALLISLFFSHPLPAAVDLPGSQQQVVANLAGCWVHSILHLKSDEHAVFFLKEINQIMGASSWWSALDWQEKTDALAEIYVPRMLEAYKIQGTSSFDLMCVDIYRRFKDG